MLVVIICNLLAVVMLLGLLAGITVGFVTARAALSKALAFERFTPPPMAQPA